MIFFAINFLWLIHLKKSFLQRNKSASEEENISKRYWSRFELWTLGLWEHRSTTELSFQRKFHRKTTSFDKGTISYVRQSIDNMVRGKKARSGSFECQKFGPKPKKSKVGKIKAIVTRTHDNPHSAMGNYGRLRIQICRFWLDLFWEFCYMLHLTF